MTSQAGVPASGLAPEASEPVWHTLNADRVLQAEEVDGQRGLSSAEVASRAQRFVIFTGVSEAIPAEPSLTALPAAAA